MVSSLLTRIDSNEKELKGLRASSAAKKKISRSVRVRLFNDYYYP